MKDFFLVLGLPRLPWLEQEMVQAAFHRLAATHHPDRAGGDAEKFSELTQAWKTLNDPVTRVRHWLELEDATFVPPMQPPEELMDLFVEVGRIRQEAAAIHSAEVPSSAIARSVQALQQQPTKARKEELRSRINRRVEALFCTLEGGGNEFAAVARIYLQLAFLTRWAALI